MPFAPPPHHTLHPISHLPPTYLPTYPPRPLQFGITENVHELLKSADTNGVGASSSQAPADGGAGRGGGEGCFPRPQ
jgi:hypothetical protein